MKLEIPGQFKGAECRAIPKVAIAIREALTPIFLQVQSETISKVSLILRVGGSLGEFAPESKDGKLRRKKDALSCEVVIQNHNWQEQSEAQIRIILSSHLKPVVAECCRYLNLSPELSSQALGALAQQSIPADATSPPCLT